MPELQSSQPSQRALWVRIAEIVLIVSLCALFAVHCFVFHLRAEHRTDSWTNQEKPIADQIGGLRELPDGVRARTTKDLAIRIRELPAASNKVRLANDLANLSTEGDFGRDRVQEVAITLADALQEQPAESRNGNPAEPYVELAQLVRYEHVKATVEDPRFSAAMSKLEANDLKRELIDFMLSDLTGKTWRLKDLRGKVVLLNFWATWCPPCRKEMPDLETLYERFQGQGLIILSISDEDAGKVSPFVRQMSVHYPVLLDPGRKVNDLFQINGIPRTFVYDRSGKLVAQSIDMRTQKQFLGMLKQAGIE